MSAHVNNGTYLYSYFDNGVNFNNVIFFNNGAYFNNRLVEKNTVVFG